MSKDEDVRLIAMTHRDFLFFKRAGEDRAGLLGNSYVNRLYENWDSGLTVEEAEAAADALHKYVPMKFERAHDCGDKLRAPLGETDSLSEQGR